MSLVDVPSPDSRTAKAREVHVTRSAHRAVDDPAKLAKAARIVRAALSRNQLTLADLTPLPHPQKGATRT
jgi:hypothetical protein